MGFNSLQSGAPGGFQSFPLGKKNVACIFCFPGLDLIKMTKGNDMLLRKGAHRTGGQYDRKIPNFTYQYVRGALGFFQLWQQLGKYEHFYPQLSCFLECSVSLNREYSVITIPSLHLPLWLIFAPIVFQDFRI